MASVCLSCWDRTPRTLDSLLSWDSTADSKEGTAELGHRGHLTLNYHGEVHVLQDIAEIKSLLLCKIGTTFED